MAEESVKTTHTKGDIVTELKELQGEFAQLLELEQVEHTYMENLVDTLRFLLSDVGVIQISPEVLGQQFHDAKKAYLASDAVVIVIDGNELVRSQALIKLPPRSILAVIQDCSPRFRKLISERKDAVSSRVTVLERIMKELKKAKSALRPTKQELEEVDIVRSSFGSE